MFHTTRSTTPGQGPRSSAQAALAACIACAALFSTQAQADVVVGWNFENATNGAQSIAASTTTASVSGATFSTGNNGVEDFGGAIGKLSLTRSFGAVSPSLVFTLASDFSGELSFNHYHNHNPGFPTTPSYQFDVQLRTDGGAWADIGSDFVASGATNSQGVSIGGLTLQAGVHEIRWVGNNFAFGNNSGSEFFGLDNVNLSTPAQGVPEPASLALVALGLMGAGLSRRRRA